MLAIMLFHQPFFFNNYFVDFFHIYGYWGVELFLFISGFGIAHSLNKNTTKQFYINRAQRIIPSCLTVGICKVFFFYLGFNEHSNPNILLLITNIYLWYIYAITTYYVFSPFFYKLIKRYGLWVIILSCVFSIVCHYIPFDKNELYLINHIGWITARLPIYLLGMYITIKPIKIRIRTIGTIGTIFLLLCMFLQLGSKMIKYKWNIFYLNIPLLFATPLLCLLCSYIKNITTKIKIHPLIELIGKYSLELYLWHEYIFWNIYRNSLFTNINAHGKCIIAVITIILFVTITCYIKGLLLKYLNYNRLYNITIK